MWDEKFETMSTDEMQAFQLDNLRKTVAWVYERVPFYTKKFQEIGIKPGDVQSLEDLGKLPFTVKNDLRDNYPYGLFAVPLKEVVRVHASSGTTGKPTWPPTPGRPDPVGQCMARTMTSAGA